LVAAIELISPGNKDRPESRRAFAAKCASYLYQGISLIIVDIVTERSANLHNETMRLMQAEQRFELPADVNLYAWPIVLSAASKKKKLTCGPCASRSAIDFPRCR